MWAGNSGYVVDGVPYMKIKEGKSSGLTEIKKVNDVKN